MYLRRLPVWDDGVDLHLSPELKVLQRGGDMEMHNLRHMFIIYICSRAQERKSPQSCIERSLTFLIIASDFRTLKLRAKKKKNGEKKEIALV